MTPLFSCQSITKSYAGGSPLFKDLSFSIFTGDKIGLVGLNGSGKSTLLKIIAKLEKADTGEVSSQKGLSVGYVPQTCEFPDVPPKEILLNTLNQDLTLYERECLVEAELHRFGFTGNEPSAASLSGGWKKRLRIAQELILSPDLLLLDEPTNHLDLEGIFWLEGFLAKESTTYLLVSHDRFFLQHVTEKIMEIDKAYPKGVFISEGTYQEFLSRKEAFLQGQLQQERRLATKARRETAWLKAGVKARTTKSQSRIDEAEEILEDYADIRARNQQKRANIDFAATERRTQKLLVAKNLSKKMGEKLLFQKLDFTLSPGTRIGLMGPNGSGKTSLLRMLAGEIPPDTGTLKPADDLKIVYFDQHRVQLPLDLSLKDALSPKGEFVTFRGNQIHVNGWCKRFLFSPDLLPMPIGKLSGGERARISIAHLMLKPADILLLDEPTNDLDIPTLEILEESLLDFPGALVLITHDRFMMERICNSVFSLGSSEKVEVFAGYSQWKASLQTAIQPDQKKSPVPSAKSKSSYQEKKELEAIERKITKTEKEIQELKGLLEEKTIAEDPKRLEEICTAIGLAETQIEQLFFRWEELDKKG